MVSAKKAENTAFDTIKNAFNTKAEAYNTAVKSEKTRLADLFAGLSTAPVTVPERPCPPTAPLGYSGIIVDLSKAVATTPVVWATPLTTATLPTFGSTAVLKTSDGTNNAAVKLSSKLGSAIAATDTTTGSEVITSSGHVFGVLGQGEKNMPASTKPFKWFTLAATDLAGMTLSMFPLEDTSTGLTATDKKVEIEIKGLTWDDYTNFTPPAASGAPIALETSLSASSVAAGLFATIGFVSSLI